MKILIGYYTKSGTTQKCAVMLRDQFHNHEMTVADLSTDQPDLQPFDAVLLGAPIRMGHMDKRFRAYLKANTAVLSGKRLGFFACCGISEQYRKVMERDIPAPLLEAAAITESFGGTLDIRSQPNLFGKVLVFFMRRSIKSKELDEDLCDSGSLGLPYIMPDHISRFADVIKQI